jgi:2-hydroxymuconate-semialdehyde hydrolase
VLVPLSKAFHVYAADLVGFGRSGLKTSLPYFDMEMWVRELRMLLDLTGRGAIVVGHSLSGPIALKAATVDERIAAVVTTATMGVPPRSPQDTGRVSGPAWRFPESRDEVRAAVERTFYDKSLAEESEVDRRLAVLQRPGYREYFEEMFAGPGDQYIAESALTDDELARVGCPVVLMHGVADASWAPEETSLALAARLAMADVHVLAACAHSVAHERPHDFVAAIGALSRRLADWEEEKSEP